MKLPGWIKVVEIRREPTCLTMICKLRWWHPGLWWNVIVQLIKDARIQTTQPTGD